MFRCAAFLLVFALTMSQQASAQVVKITTPIKRKICGPFSCRPGVIQEGVGTGVIIGRSPLGDGRQAYFILTVEHLRRDALSISVHVSGGRFPARTLSYNAERMLMLLSIEAPAGMPLVPTLPIADTMPNAGEAVTIYGFSRSEMGARSLVLRSFDRDVFTTTSPFEQGESGGPIVKNGQIFGLCEGFYRGSKIGIGPSAVAIRRFLSMPAIGAGVAGGQSATVPVRPRVPVSEDGSGVSAGPGLPVSPAGEQVSVSTPAAPRGGHQTDAPEFTPELGPPTGIPGFKPVAIPDPISKPIEITEPKRSPLETDPKSPATGSGSVPISGGSRTGDVVANVGKAAATGLDIWSLLVGAGAVAGTGGIGGLALLAWRGLKVGRAVAGVVHNRRHPSPVVQSSGSGATIASVIPPMEPLAPQNVNFVEVPMDYRRASVDYALTETGRRYPGSIATVEVVKSLINQHLQANGHGQETLHP